MISENQLEIWTNQGAVVTAQSTHEVVRRCLNEHTWPANVLFDDYLQGSYRNSTNIRGDSDVDIVVELVSAFQPDTSKLSDLQKSIFNSAVPDASYGYNEFYAEIVSVLRARFGSGNVKPGKMAIKVLAESGRIPADVVVAMTHRRYESYWASDNQTSVEGITIRNQSTGEWIVNYPKLHYSNGASKNGNACSRYKPAIRMVKNARQRALQAGYLKNGVAPSYFIESLMFNVANEKYSGSWSDIYLSTIEAAIADQRGYFLCQNQINSLFGSGSDQWKLEASLEFGGALLKLAKDY